MDYTQTQLETLHAKLPERIREILESGELEVVIAEIKQEFTLTNDQTLFIQSEVMNLLEGIISAEDFTKSLSQNRFIDRVKSEAVLEKLVEKLLGDIPEEIAAAFFIREDFDNAFLERVDIRLQPKRVTIPETPEKIVIEKSSKEQSVVEAVRETAKEFGLHVDQTGLLLDEVESVFRGELSPKDFVTHITAKLSISHKDALGIAEKINAAVFLPVRERLADAYEKNKEVKKLRGGEDENVGYLVDLDTDNDMHIVDGKLKPRTNNGENNLVSFIPESLKAPKIKHRITESEWESGGTPIGGSLLASEERMRLEKILGNEPSTNEHSFRGMPTEEEIRTLKQSLGVSEEKPKEEPPVIQKETVAPPKEKGVIAEKDPVAVAIKKYTLDPYRESFE